LEQFKGEASSYNDSDEKTSKVPTELIAASFGALHASPLKMVEALVQERCRSDKRSTFRAIEAGKGKTMMDMKSHRDLILDAVFWYWIIKPHAEHKAMK
jgi:hypothetical protein